MKKHIVLFLTLILLVTAATARADGSFPDLDLSGTLSPAHKTYLGVTTNTFKLSEIKAEYLFIEAYSMYCPICQRDAAMINEIYDKIALTGRGENIKFIGLGVGNTGFETAFYQEKYAVPFPLFQDEDYTIHKAIGEGGTPTFFIVKMIDGEREVLFKQEGESKDMDALFSTIMDKTGLK